MLNSEILTWILRFSEENLQSILEFMVNSVELPLPDLVKYPLLLTYNFEKRIIPRFRVMEALASTPVQELKIPFIQIFHMTKNDSWRIMLTDMLNPQFCGLFTIVGKLESLAFTSGQCVSIKEIHKCSESSWGHSIQLFLCTSISCNVPFIKHGTWRVDYYGFLSTRRVQKEYL